MNENTIEEAIFEARRFITRAILAKAELKTNEYANITGSPHTAACKRASMDLTRVLAKLRAGK